MIEIRKLDFIRNNFSLKIGDLYFKKNEKVAIFGNNGCGKSTFFNIATGLLKNYSGKIYYINKELKKLSIIKRAQVFSYLPQFFNIMFNFTVFEIIHLGRYPFQNTLSKYENLDKTEKLIRDLHLEYLKNKRWANLSGGEKKRVAIAKTLNQDSKIIFLDEPLAMLDIKHQIFFLNLIKLSNKIVIASSHDINLTKDYFTRFLFMKNGRIMYDVQRENVNKEIISETFDVNVCHTYNFAFS
ncbi:MAG: ABC transporter ATP-binding protein [Deferribacterota bacterium]|nr:ABC transporter ATP-binding protein [Deferribacterota bacterium]